MKKLIIAAIGMMLALNASAAKKGRMPALQFNPNSGVKASLTMPDGKVVNYTAYNKLYFVTNVEDSTYQYMNIFVPEGANEQTPIFLRTYVGGYMPSQAGDPQAQDASGRALSEGYVLVIPGSRGRTSTVQKGKKTIYTGRAPKALLDLKAAIRYLRHFDSVIPGDAEKIITDGTSAGGAMSSLMGATGNNPAYKPLLKAMGAADERDDVFASVCYCPITDLDHADMAYEWLYGNTESRKSLSESKRALTAELAAQFPAYINSLGLKKADGTSLNADNYLDYIKQIIIRSAQEAKDAGADISDSLGFTFSSEAAFQAPINGGVGSARPERMADGMPPMMRGGGKKVGEYITDLDLDKYLNYVVSTQPLKGVPSFLMMKNHLAKWSTVMVITRKTVLRVSTIKMFMVATSMDQFFLVTPTLPTAWSQLPFVTNMAKTLNCQVMMTFSQVRLLKNTQILNQKQNLRNNSMT